MDTFLVRNHCSCNLIDYSVLQIFARKNYGETWPKLRNVMVYFNYMTYIFRLNLVCLGFEFIWVHEASCFMLQLNCYRPWPNSLLSFDSTLFLLLIEKYFLLSYYNDLLIKRNIFWRELHVLCSLMTNTSVFMLVTVTPTSTLQKFMNRLFANITMLGKISNMHLT